MSEKSNFSESGPKMDEEIKEDPQRWEDENKPDSDFRNNIQQQFDKRRMVNSIKGITPGNVGDGGGGNPPNRPKETNDYDLQGIPLQYETLMRLYEIEKSPNALEELGKFERTLPKKEYDNVGESSVTDGKGRHIKDKRYNHWLHFLNNQHNQPLD